MNKKNLILSLILLGFFGLAEKAQATPTVPQNLAGRYLDRSVVYLTWDASTDLDHGGVQYYRIYRDAVYIGGAVSPNYSDSMVIHPTDYSYTVSAVDLQGYESAESAPVAVLGDSENPSVPPGMTAVATSSSAVNLSWGVATDNVGVVYYRVKKNGFQLYLLSSDVRNINDYQVEPSTTYSYTVSALDAQENESADSAPSVALTPSNDPPVIYEVGDQVIDEGALLTFDVMTVDFDGDIDTLVASNLPTGADFQITDQFMDWAIGTFSWIPDETQAGIYPGIVFTSTDNWGAETSETISITVNNVSIPGDIIPPAAPSGLGVI